MEMEIMLFPHTDEIIKLVDQMGFLMTQNEIKYWYLERLPCQVS